MFQASKGIISYAPVKVQDNGYVYIQRLIQEQSAETRLDGQPVILIPGSEGFQYDFI